MKVAVLLSDFNVLESSLFMQHESHFTLDLAGYLEASVQGTVMPPQTSASGREGGVGFPFT